jgi:hypothetical protein
MKLRAPLKITSRTSSIAKFVSWGNVSPLSFEDMVPREMWRDYWDQLSVVTKAMRAAQQKATLVRQHIMEFEQAKLGRQTSTD